MGEGSPSEAADRTTGPVTQRRPVVLIVLGTLLLAGAAVVAVAPGDGSPSEDKVYAPSPTQTGEPQRDPGGSADDTRDWSLILAATGAAAGMGSFVLGCADFARNTLRRRRVTRPSGEWRDPHAYR